MTVGRTQMPLGFSIGDRDAIVRQVRRCAAVQAPTNCDGELDKYPVGNVEPMKFIMQYLTPQAAIKLPSRPTSDNTGISVRHTL